MSDKPEPLASRLKRLREARGLSQRALARAAGLTAQAVSLVEAGRRPNLTLQTAERWAAALGVGPAELAGW